MLHNFWGNSRFQQNTWSFSFGNLDFVDFLQKSNATSNITQYAFIYFLAFSGFRSFAAASIRSSGFTVWIARIRAVTKFLTMLNISTSPASRRHHLSLTRAMAHCSMWSKLRFTVRMPVLGKFCTKRINGNWNWRRKMFCTPAGVRYPPRLLEAKELPCRYLHLCTS